MSVEPGGQLSRMESASGNITGLAVDGTRRDEQPPSVGGKRNGKLAQPREARTSARRLGGEGVAREKRQWARGCQHISLASW